MYRRHKETAMPFQLLVSIPAAWCKAAQRQSPELLNLWGSKVLDSELAVDLHEGLGPTNDCVHTLLRQPEQSVHARLLHERVVQRLRGLVVRVIGAPDIAGR